MPTVTDVAREAGVSVGTVSRVLNDGKYVTLQTRAKVLAAIEKLNYHLDSAARGLRTGRTRMIGIVVPYLEHDYYQRIIAGVENAATAAGYNVVICNYQLSIDREREFVKLVMQRRVDGLVLGASILPDAELIQVAHDAPIAIVGRKVFGDLAAPGVASDNETAAYDAVRHLIADHGRRNVAYLHGSPGPGDDQYRFSGYCRALADGGIAFRQELTGYAQTDRMAADLLERMLKTDKPPDATFCFNDMMAHQIYRRAARLGLRIPDDLAIIGVDDTWIGQYLSPTLTTIAPPAFHMGELAAAKLIDRLAGVGNTNGFTVLPAELIRRGSCGCLEPVF